MADNAPNAYSKITNLPCYLYHISCQKKCQQPGLPIFKAKAVTKLQLLPAVPKPPSADPSVAPRELLLPNPREVLAGWAEP